MELQCDICFNQFDLDQHRPKSLPCGHTVCGECVQNPALGKKCPTCRKDLAADPTDLPDTILAIRMIENDGAPPRKKPKTEETEVRQLRRGVEAGRKVVEVLRLVVPKAVEALNRQLDSSVAQLRQLEEALELQVQRGPAGGEVSDPVAEQLQLAVQLEDSLRLLTANKCSVVAEEEDGAAWRSSAPLGGFSDILRLLLLQLRADGQLEKVDGAAFPDTSGVFVGPPIISVLETDEEDFEDGDLKVNDILLDRPRWRNTRSLKCSHGDGLEELLRVLAAQLEELKIKGECNVQPMVEVERMTSLKRLSVKCVNDKSLDYPDLPLQLEELAVQNPKENQLRCVERMSRLRSLQVHDYYGPNLTFAPSQHGALRWLCVALNTGHKDTMMSLIRAYASSVQHLCIYCSVSDSRKRSFYYPDLGGDLAACGLRALLQLVLVRPKSDPCSEQVARCLLQCQAIRRSLPAHVQVVCRKCNVPAS
ncbi:uncharacterized protein LOC113202351 [Frankliniella occidentalis]|uniref:Uncharacterized protein LOC113202351 n=1 Tax=Frankliniella occidentalis TaxID=133901 RepID=A0A9C6WX71_FRAOC|nr:uncharacterized protein LOC113202351 [Frankliniella occidentalis]